MSPIWEDETHSYEDLKRLAKWNVCAVCGRSLRLHMEKVGDSYKSFLACWDWARNHHEGITRGASEFEKKGWESLNLPTRREKMVEQFGEEKTNALARYTMLPVISKKAAGEIIDVLWPKAPREQKDKAIILCAAYNLNPLMHHVFLVPFGKNEGTEWSLIMGISASRLLASRRGPFSYLDGTPRIMSDEERRHTFGDSDPDKLWVVVKLKDNNTGAEAPGYGWWPKRKTDGRPNEPYGVEKGNSMFNMAAIRAERQALDRLRPGEMPQEVAVGDEKYMPQEAYGNTSKVFVEGEVIDISMAKETSPSEAPAVEQKIAPPPDIPSEVPKEKSTSRPVAAEGDRFITKEEADELSSLAVQAGVSIKDYVQTTKKWQLKSFSQMRFSQYQEVKNYINGILNPQNK